MIFDQQVSILRAARRVDRYNNETWDWSNPERQEVTGVHVQPAAQTEDVTSEARSMVTTGWRLYTNHGDLDLRADDRVVWNGRELDVIGEVARWPHPMRPGQIHHIEAYLERRAG